MTGGQPDPVAGLLAADAATRGLGIAISDVGGGRATARMTVTPAMVNGLGICHGGFLFLLADSALGYASNGDGVPAVAAACDIVFVAPARPGDELTADAVRRAGYGRSGLYDVTVWRPADGALIAELRGQTRSPRTP